MPDYDLEDRIQKLANIRADYPVVYPLVLVGITIGIMLYLGKDFIPNFGAEIYKEIISISVTVGIIDVLYRAREKGQQRKLQQTLNWNFGKRAKPPESHNIFYTMIAQELLKGYITNYFDISEFEGQQLIIKKAALHNFNMQNTKWLNVDFQYSQLKIIACSNSKFVNSLLNSSKLFGIIWHNSTFSHISFKNAKLESIEFNNSQLRFVNFEDAVLKKVNFSGCHLVEVNFCGADLRDTNFRGAHIHSIKCDFRTILPNGKRYDPSEGDSQINKFANEHLPDFYALQGNKLHLTPNDVPNYEQVVP